MSSWKYIFFVSSALICTTAFFAYWAWGQFNSAFHDFDTPLNQLSNALVFIDHKDAEPEMGALILGSSTLPFFKFTFPSTPYRFYTGCNYSVTWLASSTITSIGLALISADKGIPLDTTVSGLTGSTSETELASIVWNIGSVPPGDYYLETTHLNGEEIQATSSVFSIFEGPKLSRAKLGYCSKEDF